MVVVWGGVQQGKAVQGNAVQGSAARGQTGGRAVPRLPKAVGDQGPGWQGQAGQGRGMRVGARRIETEDGMVAGRLHLLRRRPATTDGKRMDFRQFREQCAGWEAESGMRFGNWTRRRPRRVGELAGGSVYFVENREIRFRMELEGVVRVREMFPAAGERFLDWWALCCRPRMIRVVQREVGWLRGWRYLEGADAPADDQDGWQEDGMGVALEAFGLSAGEPG